MAYFFNSYIIDHTSSQYINATSFQSVFAQECIILGGEEEQQRNTTCLLEIAHWAGGMAPSQLTDEAAL